MSSSSEGINQSAQERQTLLSKLLDSVKQCQIRFGGRTELATESDSRVICLCVQFENVFQHGIRKNTKGLQRLKQVTEVMKGLSLLNSESESVFWHLVKNVLNKHEYERYMLLKNIHTDIGRGRAWLRSALNERSLERYIHMILSDVSQISQFYEDWAFLMDQERNSMLPMMAAGLGSILFAINIDNPDLNSFRTSNPDSFSQVTKSNCTENDSIEPQPILAKSMLNRPGKKSKKKKWPTTQVVSFDDNEMCQNNFGSVCECSSAPATCLSSPVSTVGNFLAFSSIQPELASTTVSNISCDILNEAMSDKANIPLSNSAPAVSGPDIRISSNSLVQLSPERSSFAAETDVIDNFSEPTNIPLLNEVCSEHNDSIDRKTPLASSSTSSAASIGTNENYLPVHATLTPISDASVGELIPVCQGEDVSSSADSLSIPSFCDDVDSAVVALEIAQRVHSWSLSSSGSQGSKSGSQSRSRSETLTMGADELREAVLAILQKKEDAEEKNKSLRSLLDREMEMNAGLRAEIEDMQKHHGDKIEKMENKIQTITRENELLKHQLRKYITAVQMLKHDSSRINELSAVVGDIQPPIPEPKVYIDHQFEASEYEKKLVQVAEMHGELMEFNDRLHRLLLQREVTIRRLREELIDLRGPLPDDNQTSDDEISITSDYDASSQTTPLRPLINVWIPSAFLTGHPANTHHVYQVYVRIRDDEWNVYRRYAQFYTLHKVLKKKDPIVNTFDFPPKKTIGKKDARVVEQRRRRLQHYLRCVLNWLLQNNMELANSPDKDAFIALMPFFSDQNSDAKKQEGTSRSKFHQPRVNSTTGSEQQSVQHYTGL